MCMHVNSVDLPGPVPDGEYKSFGGGGGKI